MGQDADGQAHGAAENTKDTTIFRQTLRIA